LTRFWQDTWLISYKERGKDSRIAAILH